MIVERPCATPSPLVGDDCMDAGGRVTLGAVTEGWSANVPNNADISYVHVGQGEGLLRATKEFWRTFRTLVGDDAYEKYCEHHQHHHADQPLLDRSAFYLKNQQKKWTGINRCC